MAMPDMQAQARGDVHTPGPPKDLVRAAAGVHRQESVCSQVHRPREPRRATGLQFLRRQWHPRILAVAYFVVTWPGRRRQSPARRQEAGGQGSELEPQLSEGGSALTELQLVKLPQVFFTLFYLISYSLLRRYVPLTPSHTGILKTNTRVPSCTSTELN